MKLLVVIVNYRTAGLTIDCLRSLEPEVRALGGVRVAVADNASGDDSVPRLRAAVAAGGWRDWVEVLALDRNGGYAWGNNAAIRPALASADPPPFVLLLNSDTLVRPEALGELLEFMRAHPEVGIAGSRLEDPDGTPQHSRFRFHTIWSELESGLRLGLLSRLLRRYVVSPPLTDAAHVTDWVAGASLIVRREVFADVGLLDEEYFLYFEDVDLCLNARRAGWSCWYVPRSRVVHLVGRSSGVTREDTAPGRLPRYWFDARQRYFVKNHGRVYCAVADLFWTVSFALRRARSFIQRKVDRTPPHMLTDFLRHRFGTDEPSEPATTDPVG